MKQLISAILSTFFFALTVMAAAAEEAAPAPDPAAIAAARDLMEVTGVSRQMDGMMDAVTQGFARGAEKGGAEASAAMTKEFEEFMKKFMTHKEDMLSDFAKLYAETFTAAEMKEIADFYRSGTGAKFIAATPALMQKGSAIGMKYSDKILNDMSAAGKK